jgi:general secretion pathway protein K
MRYRDSGAEFKNPRLQSGIALEMVLWILLLVTISTSAYTLMARMDQLEAHTVMWGTRARMGAETGVNLAVLALRDPDEMTRWIADGRSYELQFQDVRLEIKVTDERGKLDVNSANETTLQQLFIGHEMEQEQAIYLAAAMQDWVDSDDIERMNGAELQTYEGNGTGNELGFLSENRTGSHGLFRGQYAGPCFRSAGIFAGVAGYDAR